MSQEGGEGSKRMTSHRCASVEGFYMLCTALQCYHMRQPGELTLHSALGLLSRGTSPSKPELAQPSKTSANIRKPFQVCFSIASKCSIFFVACPSGWGLAITSEFISRSNFGFLVWFLDSSLNHISCQDGCLGASVFTAEREQRSNVLGRCAGFYHHSLDLCTTPCMYPLGQACLWMGRWNGCSLDGERGISR